MAIKTMTMSSGKSLFSTGWHEVTISKAAYGTWNESQYVEMHFEDYPDNFNFRIYSANNKETGEEFNLARLFRLANAGIISVLKDPTGSNPVVQYDDEAEGLVGKKINIYLYKKDGEKLTTIHNRIAPVTQQGEHISYTDDDVSMWKGVAEKALENSGNAGSMMNGSPATATDSVPF